MQVVEREVEHAQAELRVLRQERRLAVSVAWLTLWAAQEAANTAHDEERVAKELVTRLTRAAETGAGTRVELAAARAFAAEAEVTRLHGGRAFATSRDDGSGAQVVLELP